MVSFTVLMNLAVINVVCGNIVGFILLLHKNILICVLQGEKDEDNESRKVDANRYRSRGSYDEDKYERYSIERSSSFGKDDRRIKCYFDDIRSPRYSRENSRNGGHKRNPVRFEIVDDRFRDDRFGSRRFFLEDTASQRRLPNTNTNTESCSSPALRPLQETLGDNFPTLRVGEISKENNGKQDNHPARNQASNCHHYCRYTHTHMKPIFCHTHRQSYTSMLFSFLKAVCR